MKFVALISGGKDSFYSIMNCIRNGHELIACAHLAPRRKQAADTEEEEEESYMYQTAASECIPTLVEECLGVPLIIRECVGRSKNTSLVYDHNSNENDDNSSCDKILEKEEPKLVEDEVEDLYLLLKQIQETFPQTKGISSGAILSTYQRTRIESVCSRLNLTPLGYLWRAQSQKQLLESMLQDGIEAVMVKVASPPGLIPYKHLNKTLGTLYYSGLLDRLKDRFDFHICGEGGEYETLVLDCPLFKEKKLELTEVEIVESSAGDGVGNLIIRQCRAVPKGDDDISCNDEWMKRNLDVVVCEDQPDEVVLPSLGNPKIQQYPKIRYLPHVKILPGGLAHISELYSQTIPRLSSSQLSSNLSEQDREAELAVMEAKSILSTLQILLSNIQWHKNSSDDGGGATAKDVVFVHLYLSSISHFARINSHYRDFFGTVLPPSRSCVAVGRDVLPGGRRVMLDCLVQRGSGEYMRIQPDDTDDNNVNTTTTNFVRLEKQNPHHKLRSNLHVQTISNWAPVCVGPYSQANTLRSSITFLAGQIGLVPATMTLIEGGWRQELIQSWKNAASVLDALESSLNDVVGGVVYISSDIIQCNSNGNDNATTMNTEIWDVVSQICQEQLKNNGGINAGHIDDRSTNDSNTEEMYGGFEDYETWKEVMGEDAVDSSVDPATSSSNDVPLLVVTLPQMPVGAVSEVELICATKRASSCLSLSTSRKKCMFHPDEDSVEDEIGIPWEMGYSNVSRQQDDTMAKRVNSSDNAIEIESSIRQIGTGCTALAFVLATPVDNDSCLSTQMLDPELILERMVNTAIECIEDNSGLDKVYALHVRLFYTATGAGEDALEIRGALRSALRSQWRVGNESKKRIIDIPAYSVVPVRAMYTPTPSDGEEAKTRVPILAMQVITCDLIHMETEMWVNHDR